MRKNCFIRGVVISYVGETVFLYHRVMPALWWQAMFSNFRSVLNYPLVFQPRTMSVAGGVVSKNNLAIPICLGSPTLTRCRPGPFTGL